MHVERVHCVKRRKGDKSKKLHSIICNLLSFKEERLIMNNSNKLKGKNIFIDEDNSFETMEYTKKLWDEIKYLRSQGQIGYFNYQSIVNKGVRSTNMNE